MSGSVHEAWNLVMQDVTALGKNQRNQAQKFNFRGIDDVMNAVGPVLRDHGVMVIPSITDLRSRDFTSKGGGLMHEVHVMVDFTIVGPDGSTIVGSAPGESADSGDKATPKAMSVAYRTFLLQALCLPTDEPDPDSQVTDRSPAQTDDALAQTTADGLLKATDVEAVKRVFSWASDKGLMDHTVNDGTETAIPLRRLFDNTYARLGSTEADAAAEQTLKDSLGAERVETESSVTEPTEEAKA